MYKPYNYDKTTYLVVFKEGNYRTHLTEKALAVTLKKRGGDVLFVMKGTMVAFETKVV